MERKRLRFAKILQVTGQETRECCSFRPLLPQMWSISQWRKCGRHSCPAPVAGYIHAIIHMLTFIC